MEDAKKNISKFMLQVFHVYLKFVTKTHIFLRIILFCSNFIFLSF